MNYAKREDHKTEGWQLYYRSHSVLERAQGLMMVIEAHYDRNPEAPSFKIYASHWLWASQAQYDRDVLDLLIARFPLPNHPRIQCGYSDWDSYGKPTYRIAA